MKRVLVIAALLLTIARPVKAEEVYRAEATAYCLSGETASGVYTDEIVATGRKMVASKPEWIGSLMMVWLDEGNGIEADNFIGLFEVLDTGSTKIRTGKVIDVYIPSYDEAKQFGRKKVIFQIIKGEG